MTPLHWAVQNGHAEAVAALIDSGAKIELTNKFQLTPLDIAIQIKRADIIEIITSKLTPAPVIIQNFGMSEDETSNCSKELFEEDLPLGKISSEELSV